MKKHTLTLSVVLLTVLSSFQDAQAMGGAKRFAQSLFEKAKKAEFTPEDMMTRGLAGIVGLACMYYSTPPFKKNKTAATSDEISIETALKFINTSGTDLREQIKSLYTEKDFALFVKINTLGFPVINEDPEIDTLFIKKFVDKIQKNGSATVSSNGVTLTLGAEHVFDLATTFIEGLEQHLTKVKKESDELEVQVQKQVLGLEGVTN